MGSLYRNFARPVVFLLGPETAHIIAKRTAKQISKSDYLLDKLSHRYCADDERLHTTVFGIDFPNPVGLAAGYDKNGEIVDFFAALGFGYAVIGSVTAERNAGNEGQKMWRLPDDYAALNRRGLDSDGYEKVHSNLGDRNYKIPVVVNIAKTNDRRIMGYRAIEDYLKSFVAFYDMENVAIIEINVSCPNTEDGRSFENPENLDALVYNIRKKEKEIARNGRKPIVVKFSPDNDCGKQDEMIAVCEGYGIDGYTLVNASKKWEYLKTDRKILDKIIKKYGFIGLSGRPIRDKATKIIERIYRQTKGKKPIMGCGGIFSAEDGIIKMLHGASLLQVCTGLPYEGPSMAKEMKEGFLKYMEITGLERASDIVGRLVDL